MCLANGRRRQTTTDAGRHVIAVAHRRNVLQTGSSRTPRSVTAMIKPPTHPMHGVLCMISSSTDPSNLQPILIPETAREVAGKASVWPPLSPDIIVTKQC
jgi:hypothetical protein